MRLDGAESEPESRELHPAFLPVTSSSSFMFVDFSVPLLFHYIIHAITWRAKVAVPDPSYLEPLRPCTQPHARYLPSDE